MNNLQELFDKLKIEMLNQTKDIISQMDEKLMPIKQELEELKTENCHLKTKIANLIKNSRINNIIVYGFEENEKSQVELMESVIKKLNGDLNVQLEKKDINILHRIGKKDKPNNKKRPILISFVNLWKKIELMKKKKNLKGIYISEDYPKEIQEKRKELQIKLIEERKKGKYAIINYDKLIVKEALNLGGRKRNLGNSPETINQPRKQLVLKGTNRKNAFDIMRERSNSFSSISPEMQLS